MAYAALRNATGDREYVAARLGHLSDETKLILNRFGFEPPLFIKNMRTQVMGPGLRHPRPSSTGR